MSKATKCFSLRCASEPCGWLRINSMSLPHAGAATMSIVFKIGCTGQTPNEWVKKADADAGNRASGPLSLASEILTAMLSPRRSTASTKRSPFVGADHGVASRPLGSPR